MTTYPLVFPPANKVVNEAGCTADLDSAWNSLQALAGVNVCDSQWSGGADPTGALDCTAAFNSAIAAAGAGTVFVPPGTYKVAGPLNPVTSGCTLAGAGIASRILWDGGAVATLIKMGDTTQRTFHIRDLRISNTNASAVGTAIDASYFVYSDLARLLIDGSTKAPNQGIIFNSATTFYNWARLCRVNVDGTNAIGIRFDGGANNNHVLGGRVFISASDATQTAYVVNAKSCSLYSPNCQGGAGIGIDVQATGVACGIYDPYLENNATANIRLASGVLAPVMIGGTVENDTALTPNITDNGATGPVRLGLRTSKGGDVYADTQLLSSGTGQPEDNTLIGWAFDPASIANATAITAGVAYFVKIPVRRVTSISKVWFHIAAAATGITAGQNFFGLYQQASPGAATAALLASASADTAIASTGPQPVAISAQTVAPGYVYACIMVNATGMPTIGRTAGAVGTGNAGLTTSTWRFFSNPSGNTTSLPASVTLASNSSSTGSPLDFWAAVS